MNFPRSSLRAFLTWSLWSLLILGIVMGCSRTKQRVGVVDMTAQHESKEAKDNSIHKRVDELDRRKGLTELQYEVTQNAATERPFANAYWNHHEAGIYVDIVSGEPLFSSLDKYDSGTGWPSFTRPIEDGSLVERDDDSLGMHRVEVRSKRADSHLGHLFHDGPPSTGLRYCINSAALRFVPVNRMRAEGYGDLLGPFIEAGLAPGGVSRDSPESADERHDGKTEQRQTAIVAGGCFWGVEHLMRKLEGVLDTQVGYIGGSLERPSYQQVSTGLTGHAEAVRVIFDPRVVSYADVLRYFFRLHDPTTVDRQHHDVGTQYRSAIFYLDEQQRETAERIKAEVDGSGKWSSPVVTQVVEAGTFWDAEEYHQDYLVHHPNGYNCHVLRD